MNPLSSIWNSILGAFGGGNKPPATNTQSTLAMPNVPKPSALQFNTPPNTQTATQNTPLPQQNPQTAQQSAPARPPVQAQPTGQAYNGGGLQNMLGGISSGLQNLSSGLSTFQAQPPAPKAPAFQDQYQALLGNVRGLTGISPEEEATRKKLDEYNASLERGISKIEGTPEILRSLIGEEAQLQKQGQAQAGLLTNQLALAQAKRAAALEGAKTELEGYKYQIDREDKASANRYAQEKDARTEKESARRFEAEQALSEKKFEQDKSEFGLTYAQNERKIQLDTKNKLAEATAVNDTKTQASLGAANVINQLLNSDYAGITGGILGKSILTRLGTTNQTELNLAKNIQAQLALGARQLIKGSGAISDFEAKTLSDAASALGIDANGFSNLSNAAFKNALVQARGALMSNAGLEVTFQTTDPITGEKSPLISGTRDGIAQAIADGLIVEYK